MADSSRHAAFYIEESTYGETPVDPDFTRFRNTGLTLAVTKNTNTSEELREDRQITCFNHGVKQVAGDVSFELSAENYDDLLAAAVMGSWEDASADPDAPVGAVSHQKLKAGVQRRSFSILRHFSDIAAVGKPYHLFTGVEMNNVSLSIAPDSIITGSFSTIGQDLTLSETEPVNATYSTKSNSCPFNAFTGTIKEDGVVISVATEITLTLENGLEPRNVVGSDTTLRPSVGRSNLSGQATVFFENHALLEKFLNESHSSLEFSLQRGNVTYTFILPNIVYTGGQPDTSGTGSISLPMPFQALLDAAEGSNIIITKTVNP